MLILSLFPGIGLLDRAFEEAGFCVVRGPDLLWGGDVRTFHPPADRFDGIIGGPPCQPWSPLAAIVQHNARTKGYKQAVDLIPEYERCVREGRPEWFIMEEAPAAPLPSVRGYRVHDLILDNRDFGAAQERIRRISFGTRDGRPLPIERAEQPSLLHCPTVTGGARLHDNRMRQGPRGLPGRGPLLPLPDMLERQGFPRDMLDDCGLTVKAQRQAIGNGVPLPMGRAIAQAVKRAFADREQAA